jgi:hypothetical protein
MATKHEHAASGFAKRAAGWAKLEKVAVEKSYQGIAWASPRYTPSQRRALFKLDHSRETFGLAGPGGLPPGMMGTSAEAAEEAKVEAAEASARKQHEGGVPDDPTITSPWDAATKGNVRALRRIVETAGFDVASHDDGPDGGGGDTVLHLAAWYGHCTMVKYLLKTVRSRETISDDGLKAVANYANSVDSSHNGSTPIMQACRHNLGMMSDRLAIIELLVGAGANIAAQDASGDNALHWATRSAQLPIVRFIVERTEASVFASVAQNFKRQKPIDIAAALVDKRPTFSRLTIFTILQKLKRGCNLRLKIQLMAKERKDREAADARRRAFDVQSSVSFAQEMIMLGNRAWDNQHAEAEKIRTRDERKVCAKVAEAAVEDAKLWVNSKFAKDDIKAAIRDEVRFVRRASFVDRRVPTPPSPRVHLVSLTLLFAHLFFCLLSCTHPALPSSPMLLAHTAADASLARGRAGRKARRCAHRQSDGEDARDSVAPRPARARRRRRGED